MDKRPGVGFGTQQSFIISYDIVESIILGIIKDDASRQRLENPGFLIIGQPNDLAQRLDTDLPGMVFPFLLVYAFRDGSRSGKNPA